MAHAAERARSTKVASAVGVQPAAATLPAPPAIPVGAAFPIVGIGASAGGLEALEVFLQHVPVNSGMAFVVVQHLDPTHEAILAALLQRATPMRVTQVSDGLLVAPDCVYVIPPNADLSIEDGVLHVTAPTSVRGLRLPIDHLFESLAEHTLAPAIGVILSGMGTDGTLGLGAIKAHGGVAFVQEPATAKFDGMPASAVAAGVADVVAAVESLPGKIVEHLQRALPGAIASPSSAADAPGTLDDVLGIVKAQTGRDFTQYKQNTIGRRLERRMGLHHVNGIATYARFLSENPQEVELLSKELLIGVTSFFRDPSAWDALKTAIAANVTAAPAPRQPLRAWVAGCSTGEEAFSLAILCHEVLEALAPEPRPVVQIFATDLSHDAIERARVGTYPASIADDMSAERLQQFFLKTEHGYRVTKAIRETVIFAPHDVTTDPPFSKLDILICRNLLIYLTPETQHKLLPRFHHGLKPGGILFLGSAETIGDGTSLFAPIDIKARLFRRLEAGAQAIPVEFPAAARHLPAAELLASAPREPGGSMADAAHLLLQSYAPAGVLVNTKGDILFVSGRTGKYLEPAAGKANWNLFAMARDGLRQELAAGFRKAFKLKQAVTRRQVQIATHAGARAIDVTVHPIDDAGVLRGLAAVVFTDVAMPVVEPASRSVRRAAGTTVATLRRGLSVAERELRLVRADHQGSQEALTTVNEEMQSTNEELQSTNEELTTSKEEMQSLNEELQTLNQELQARVDGLSRLTNDMKNLLDNTDVATVFLDLDLRVRLFTAGSTRIFHLVPSDAGRPITDLASTLDYPALADDAREVLRTLAVHEQRTAAQDGRWVMARIMPYRTLDNMVDGVTITFADITASTILEQQLRATQAGLELHIEAQTRQIEHADRNPVPVPTPAASVSRTGPPTCSTSHRGTPHDPTP